MKICIINYGIGNFFSIKNALSNLNYKCEVSNNENIIEASDVLIFTGVGAFDSVMKNIKKIYFYNNIHKIINKKIIGICSGMQILMNKSQENNSDEKGLELINGEVKYLKDYINYDVKYPNTGWNKIEINTNLQNFKRICDNEFYFTHSLFCEINDKDTQILAYNKYYGFKYPCFIKKKNIFGIQFHPEKSRTQGLNLLNEIIKI
jgi:glutamine amidotransferase